MLTSSDYWRKKYY